MTIDAQRQHCVQSKVMASDVYTDNNKAMFKINICYSYDQMSSFSLPLSLCEGEQTQQ